jgi:hypothetical protein
MAKSWKRDKGHPYHAPSSWRRKFNRLFRARCSQRMREGEFENLGHPKRFVCSDYI